MTQPKNPEVGLLDRDRAHRMMMAQGSKMLLERLAFWHPEIVGRLQEKNGVVFEEQRK